MNFTDRYTLADGGYLGLPQLSCYDGAGGSYILFYMQNSCVLRLTKGTMDYAVVSLAFAGGQTVDINVLFVVGSVAYIPLTDVFAANYIKWSSLNLAPIAQTATMTVECFTAADVSIGATTYNLRIADVGGVTSYTFGSPFSHVLPETFVFRRLPNYDELNHFVLRMLCGARTVEVLNGGGSVIDSFSSSADGGTVGRSIAWNANPNNRAAFVRVLDALSNELELSTVEWRDGCNSDSVLLTWWSSADGGYKTRVAEIDGVSDRVTDVADYTRMFDARQDKTASHALEVSFPRLSFRDYAYYKDILSSGEVYVIEEVTRADGYKVARIPVTVSGEYPTDVRGDGISVEFSVVYHNSKSL